MNWPYFDPGSLERVEQEFDSHVCKSELYKEPELFRYEFIQAFSPVEEFESSLQSFMVPERFEE